MIALYAKDAWTAGFAGLQNLLDEVIERGYNIYGPRVDPHGVRLAQLTSVHDLPVGWEDHQDRGSYQLSKTENLSVFGIVHGSDSAKGRLFPSESVIWRAKVIGGSLHLVPEALPHEKSAILGLRPCDLRAIHVQDLVFKEGSYQDPGYSARRENTLLIAVNCTRTHPTCFCTSVGGSTKADSGFDIAITELAEGEEPRYVLEAGSKIGSEILEACGYERCPESLLDQAASKCEAAAEGISGRLETEGLKDLLYRSAESPRWQQVGERCFACTSCTQVCPTCFCHNTVEHSSLDGAEFDKTRVWDSCFSEEFAYIHGGSIRRSISSRYRQWMTHKLGAWEDQFGVMGCVGCGRCITWCPAGIDIRDEADGIRRQDLAINQAPKASNV